MLFLYFSGTGNTKEYLAKKIDPSALVCSIEESKVLEAIKMNREIVVGYPIYYSNLPKILRDFIISYRNLWEGKNVFLVATMGLFSGDGTGVMARIMKKYNANVVSGLHLRMPDCILDVKMLKNADNQKLVQKAKKNYRCINHCPREAITLIGKKVVAKPFEQYD